MRTAAGWGPGGLWRSEGLSWLHTVVEDDAFLASEWIVDLERSRATWYRRNDVSLVAEGVHLDNRRLIGLLTVHATWAQTHRVELLSGSCNVSKLLLELSLLLRKAGIRSQQLTIQALIELSSVVINLNGRRGKNLLWTQVHLLVEFGVVVVACTREESAGGGLWDGSIVVHVLRRSISAALEAKPMVA